MGKKSEKRTLITVINTSLLEMRQTIVELSRSYPGGWFYVCWDEGGSPTYWGSNLIEIFGSCSQWGRRMSAGLDQFRRTDEIVSQIIGMSKTLSNESLLCEPTRLTPN
ncbi:MAG: hypothetical protein U1D41_14920 [Nitrosomonas sp.]|uniref:hypothetical protein n=1 Tax=Nitrosomonas sp. TaxID=42353 RepID=UPI00272F11A2|nr:hypothetical protein [Nitrosomonas sp.]MDP2224740.1 hypothetical protein [Nitrosomonas sp.]MDP3663207.1 hypothetical protein [Nitrosomonas sp.]MDZ4107420.1 hypothetical protein [Nitrosomonas sp.]